MATSYSIYNNAAIIKRIIARIYKVIGGIHAVYNLSNFNLLTILITDKTLIFTIKISSE